MHQDDDMYPNNLGVPPTHPQLSESITKPPPHPAFLKLSSISKTFSTETAFHYSEDFTTLKSSPPQGLLHSETLSVLKASALNLKL